MARHQNHKERHELLHGELSAEATLRDESERLDRLGIAASVVSVEFRSSDDPARDLRRARRLLTYQLAPSDLFLVGSETSAVLLRTPVESIVDLAAWIHDIARKLDRAGLHAEIGFALRRGDENLLDTWARADASADRALARSTRSTMDAPPEWAVRPIA